MERLSRTSLAQQPRPPAAQEARRKHQIDERAMAHRSAGARAKVALLQAEYGPTNRQRVQRSMREMGIAGRTPGLPLSRRAAQHRSYLQLLRGVHDTILTERFRRSLTYEEVYSPAYVSPRGACLGIGCSIALPDGAAAPGPCLGAFGRAL